MGNIKLEKAGNQSITTISNYFIDEYMPHANGEFIKIYIYLLRIAENPIGEFSLSTIADIFNHTEADVMRALRYWEKLGLLSISYDEFKTLSSIKLEDISAKQPTLIDSFIMMPPVSVTTDNVAAKKEVKDSRDTKESVKEVKEIKEVRKLRLNLLLKSWTSLHPTKILKNYYT